MGGDLSNCRSDCCDTVKHLYLTEYPTALPGIKYFTHNKRYIYSKLTDLRQEKI